MSSSFLISDGKKAFFHEAIVNLTTHDLERHKKVSTGLHGPCDDGEILLAEKIVMEDPRVQAEIKKFNSLREPLLSVTLTHMVLGIDLIATASFN